MRDDTEDETPDLDVDEIDIEDLKIDTLAGDIRDVILGRLRDMKRPWPLLTEGEQREVANSAEMAARQLVRATVRALTDWEWPRCVIKLGEVKIIGGDKSRIEAKIAAANIEANRNVLGDHAGGFAMILMVDSEAFMGEREPTKIDPDQPELPEQSGDDEEDTDEGDDDEDRDDD